MKKSNETELIQVGVTTGNVAVFAEEKTYTKEDALKAAKGLFNALAEATDDPALAVQIINAITQGITEDPAFSKQVFTPENIYRVYALKAKADAGKITMVDVEQAFPIIPQKLGPLWGMIRGLKF